MVRLTSESGPQSGILSGEQHLQRNLAGHSECKEPAISTTAMTMSISATEDLVNNSYQISFHFLTFEFLCESLMFDVDLPVPQI